MDTIISILQISNFMKLQKRLRNMPGVTTTSKWQDWDSNQFVWVASWVAEKVSSPTTEGILTPLNQCSSFRIWAYLYLIVPLHQLCISVILGKNHHHRIVSTTAVSAAFSLFGSPVWNEILAHSLALIPYELKWLAAMLLIKSVGCYQFSIWMVETVYMAIFHLQI